jgi:DNA-directed RNA polymerase subunit K/omega
MTKAKHDHENAQQKKHLIATGELKMDATLPQMLDERRNKYLLVDLIARRSRELNRGDRALVNMPQPHTHAQLALSEMRQGKLRLERKATSKVLVNLIESE